MNARTVALSVGSFVGGSVATWFISGYIPKLINPHTNNTTQRGLIGVGVATCSGLYYTKTESLKAVGFTLGAIAYTAFDAYTLNKYSRRMEAKLIELL